jgi:hypothetical protein
MKFIWRRVMQCVHWFSLARLVEGAAKHMDMDAGTSCARQGLTVSPKDALALGELHAR